MSDLVLFEPRRILGYVGIGWDEASNFVVVRDSGPCRDSKEAMAAMEQLETLCRNVKHKIAIYELNRMRKGV